MLLGLHAKYTVIDGRRVLIGSSNLDPRSLRINTEILVAVESRGLARQILTFTQPDFERVNAWQLSLGQDGAISWLGDGIRVNTEPAEHTFQRIEEWFFAHLPIEDEM
jgi:putative cardiolipin synthase